MEEEETGAGAELQDGYLRGTPAAVVELPLAVRAANERGATRVGSGDGANPLLGDHGGAGDGFVVDYGGAEADREASGGFVGMRSLAAAWIVWLLLRSSKEEELALCSLHSMLQCESWLRSSPIYTGVNCACTSRSV